MESNPYASPQADTNGPQHAIDYRRFGGQQQSFRLTFRTYEQDVRHQARQAIDVEIGAENVVSIVEHKSLFEGFSLVVWYRVPSLL